ncbi:hypothetical protein PANT111_560039 [Pantoea brenneri]|uniref:Uncharacterized protein n=1 Tax=Pantoea brenneri TaxID=472694 RepID=A0AAX3JC68_9GAMM|nr:hypothetical protein PANT111_560039 [Pantoea brenneri]
MLTIILTHKTETRWLELQPAGHQISINLKRAV